MKEFQILFQTEMVQANIDGRKTMTRRLIGLEAINESPGDWYVPDSYHSEHDRLNNTGKIVLTNRVTGMSTTAKCPYGFKDALLWVRETWRLIEGEIYFNEGKYALNEFSHFASAVQSEQEMYKWKPSIHMPKIAARVWLKVVSVRLERLQDISESDAVKEGVATVKSDMPVSYKNYTPGMDWDGFGDARHSFESLWIYIDGTESWKANPWVWVVEYEVLSVDGRPKSITINNQSYVLK